MTLRVIVLRPVYMVTLLVKRKVFLIVLQTGY